VLFRSEEDVGRRRVSSIIQNYKPPIVCFIGKITYEKFSQLKDFNFGWQKANVYKSRIFVMHFPIRGKASVRIEELKAINSFSCDAVH